MPDHMPHTFAGSGTCFIILSGEQKLHSAVELCCSFTLKYHQWNSENCNLKNKTLIYR